MSHVDAALVPVDRKIVSDLRDVGVCTMATVRSALDPDGVDVNRENCALLSSCFRAHAGKTDVEEEKERSKE